MITILLEFHAVGARLVADDALIDDVASADDGFRARTGVFGILFVGSDGFHARVENGLHWLHVEWFFLFLYYSLFIFFFLGWTLFLENCDLLCNARMAPFVSLKGTKTIH